MKKRQLSQLKKKLPKIPGILGRNESQNSAILVLLFLKEGSYHFIFQKRNKSIRQGGEVCFPGGRIDPSQDKNSKDTAIRETCEEMGIEKNQLKIIGQMDTLVIMGGAVIDAFVGTVDIAGIDQLKPDPSEVEKVFSVPVDFFLNNEPERHPVFAYIDPYDNVENGNREKIFNANELGLPEVYDSSWGKKKYDVLIYRYKGEIIWGITARFVLDIISKLMECK